VVVVVLGENPRNPPYPLRSAENRLLKVSYQELQHELTPFD